MLIALVLFFIIRPAGGRLGPPRPFNRPTELSREYRWIIPGLSSLWRGVIWQSSNTIRDGIWRKKGGKEEEDRLEGGFVEMAGRDGGGHVTNKRYIIEECDERRFKNAMKGE